MDLAAAGLSLASGRAGESGRDAKVLGEFVEQALIGFGGEGAALVIAHQSKTSIRYISFDPSSLIVGSIEFGNRRPMQPFLCIE
jgi:hypothetical protein